MSNATQTSEGIPAVGEDEHGAEHDHPSDWLYIQVAIILAVITAAEVSTYLIDFGDLLWPALMVMMVAKFALVVMFFMHLRFDHKLFSWVFVAGLVLAIGVYIAALASFEYW